MLCDTSRKKVKELAEQVHELETDLQNKKDTISKLKVIVLPFVLLYAECQIFMCF